MRESKAGELKRYTATKDDISVDLLMYPDGSTFDFIGERPTYKIANKLQNRDTCLACGFMLIERGEK